MAQPIGSTSSSPVTGKVLVVVVPSTVVGALAALTLQFQPTPTPVHGVLAVSVALLVAFIVSVGLAHRLRGPDVPRRVGATGREQAPPCVGDLEAGGPGRASTGRTGPGHSTPERPTPQRSGQGRVASDSRDPRESDGRNPEGPPPPWQLASGRGQASAPATFHEGPGQFDPLENPLTHLPVGERQWWEAPPRDPGSSGSGAGSPRPAVRSLSDYQFRPQVASCPNCNGFALDVTGSPSAREYTFTCRDCRRATTWRPGTEWPPVRHDTH